MSDKKTYRVLGYDKDNDVYEPVVEASSEQMAKICAKVGLHTHLYDHPLRSSDGEPFDWFAVDDGTNILSVFTIEYPNGTDPKNLSGKGFKPLYLFQVKDGDVVKQCITKYTFNQKTHTYRYSKTGQTGKQQTYLIREADMDRCVKLQVYTFNPSKAHAIHVLQTYWNMRLEQLEIEVAYVQSYVNILDEAMGKEKGELI